MSLEKQFNQIQREVDEKYRPSSRKSSRSIAYRAKSFVDTYVQPNSIDYETGSTRLITVDMIRGVAVLVMTFTHIVDDMVEIDENLFLNYMTRWQLVMLSPIAIVAVVFGGMKLMFGYISGMAYSVTFANRMLGLDVRTSARECFKQFQMTALALPLLYFFGLLHTYNFHAPSQFFANPAGKPFTAYTWCYSCPVFFAALAPVVTTPIVAFVSLLLNTTALTKQYKQKIAIFAYLVIGLALNWVFPLIRVAINRAVERRYGVKFEFLDETTEFLVDHWHNLPRGAPIGEILFHLFAAHTSGYFMPVFPFIGGYIAGVSMGTLAQHIRDLRVDGDAKERRSKKIKAFNKLFRLYEYVALAGIIPACIIGYQSHKRGLRHQIFWLGDYPAVFDPRIELVAIQIPFCALMIYCGFLIFEMNSQYEKHSRRILFLRRISTYSLTIYIFEGVNRILAAYHMLGRYPTLIGYHKMETFWPCFEYYATYVLVITIVSLLLDNVDGKLSVEWLLNKYACLFKPMKSKKISDCHLKIRPMNIFD